MTKFLATLVALSASLLSPQSHAELPRKVESVKNQCLKNSSMKNYPLCVFLLSTEQIKTSPIYEAVVENNHARLQGVKEGLSHFEMVVDNSVMGAAIDNASYTLSVPNNKTEQTIDGHSGLVELNDASTVLAPKIKVNYFLIESFWFKSLFLAQALNEQYLNKPDRLFMALKTLDNYQSLVSNRASSVILDVAKNLDKSGDNFQKEMDKSLKSFWTYLMGARGYKDSEVLKTIDQNDLDLATLIFTDSMLAVLLHEVGHYVDLTEKFLYYSKTQKKYYVAYQTFKNYAAGGDRVTHSSEITADVWSYHFLRKGVTRTHQQIGLMWAMILLKIDKDDASWAKEWMKFKALFTGRPNHPYDEKRLDGVFANASYDGSMAAGEFWDGYENQAGYLSKVLSIRSNKQVTTSPWTWVRQSDIPTMFWNRPLLDAISKRKFTPVKFGNPGHTN